MSSIPQPARPAVRPRAGHPLRWLAIGVLSLLIHLVALDALPHRTIAASDDEPRGETLHATLAPIQPTREPPKAAAPVPTAPPKPRVTPRPAPPPTVATTFVPESTEPVQEVRVLPPAPPAPTPVAPPPVPEPAVVAAPPPVATTPPASARLDYRVISQNVKETNPIYGKGTITWSIVDGRYGADLKAAADVFLFKFDVLASHSDGIVGPTGLAPERYTESPRHRATVATNFNRDARQSITFSASSASVPLVAGAQDRLSVLFQLGALLLADPGKTTPGTAFEIPVAGVRGEVEQWRFDVRGSETLDTGVGALSTTHLQRAPRPGSNDRTIDVWVAQADGGYPARVLYTEPSGNTVMMTLDRISAAP
jgi:hypothetical protein